MPLWMNEGMFFFSSRRRHTRYWRDWSSDVCSSDLLAAAVRDVRSGGRRAHVRERAGGPRGRGGADRRRLRHLRAGGPAEHVPPLRPGSGVTFLERALELAERGRG